jgi:GTPase SAR1 family protein
MTSSSNSKQTSYNICILGADGVGKTTYLKSVTPPRHDGTYKTTFNDKTIHFTDTSGSDHHCMLNKWDDAVKYIAGRKQMRIITRSAAKEFKEILPQYDGFIVMFDLSNAASALTAHNIVKQINMIYPTQGKNTVLLGNKSEINQRAFRKTSINPNNTSMTQCPPYFSLSLKNNSAYCSPDTYTHIRILTHLTA